MGYAIGFKDGRDIGYGVPSLCDQPECDTQIDRGMAFACGSFRNDNGCGLYFCSIHLHYVYNQDGEFCDQCCKSFNDEKTGAPYEPKPDIDRWIWWKLNAPSWGRWRSEQSVGDLADMQEQIKDFEPWQELLEDMELDGENA